MQMMYDFLASCYEDTYYDKLRPLWVQYETRWMLEQIQCEVMIKALDVLDWLML